MSVRRAFDYRPVSVYRSHMPEQSVLNRERPCADQAFPRFCAAVFVRDMVVQRVALFAGERTLTALVRPLVCMCPDMLFQMLASFGGVFAHVTRERSLVCVRFFVLNYHSRRCGCQTTHIARIRLLTRMRSEMYG